ncbi:DUF7344 domain-containing protein [Haloprofundus salilacus]|uniref:DUF7344 domain-containing protein n=1 Tax=Haloprofundus salilacus TaxID=2876190 RepID=UPI001CCFC4D1|nr:hypothetical protein [Haloprofundus salilacus]
MPKITQSETLPCSETELFEIFGDSVRRQVLSYLYSGSRKVVSTNELAERCIESDEVATDDSDQLASTLHHLHLPKLDDVGLLDYDPDAGEVLGPDEDTVDAGVAELMDVLSRVVE